MAEIRSRETYPEYPMIYAVIGDERIPLHGHSERGVKSVIQSKLKERGITWSAGEIISLERDPIDNSNTSD